VRCDVTREGDVRDLVRAVVDRFGRLDVLVNNAGIQKAQAITEMALDDWERMMAVHLRGAFLCSREAARVMIAQGSGRIILLSSQLAYTGRPNYSAYSAAKGGLLTFTRALAQELAPHGILVNAVAPSLMDTPANRKSMPKADYAAWPKVEEVAATIAFLASPDNAVTRGGVVPVYGKS
jgi:NAD(P)-dependent dehydrogenase (short-subunit alcohol dehydrogenase family)